MGPICSLRASTSANNARRRSISSGVGDSNCEVAIRGIVVAGKPDLSLDMIMTPEKSNTLYSIDADSVSLCRKY